MDHVPGSFNIELKYFNTDFNYYRKIGVSLIQWHRCTISRAFDCLTSKVP